MEHFRGAKIPAAVGFIDAINTADRAAFERLVGDGYYLKVFDEPVEEGRERGIEGMLGYCQSFPRYLIHPTRLAVKGDVVAVLGFTTGSHLGLPDEEESKLTLIWLASVRDGRVVSWTLIEDTGANRREWGLAE
jgi:ketosteroid isomerase-like protein